MTSVNILEHHHEPNKHTRTLNAIKYTRKKIKESKLEDDKVKEFEEVKCASRVLCAMCGVIDLGLVIDDI